MNELPFIDKYELGTQSRKQSCITDDENKSFNNLEKRNNFSFFVLNWSRQEVKQITHLP